MRRIAATFGLVTAVVVGPAAAAGATHARCVHTVTAQAHGSVPHHTEGNHNAHSRIPYCPPQDAPGHGG